MFLLYSYMLILNFCVHTHTHTYMYGGEGLRSYQVTERQSRY